MNLIQIRNGSKTFGSKNIFQDATFSINAEEHVGVIGPNGAGKSTLFRILTEEDHLDGGEVVRSRELRLGYLEQEVHWKPDQTVESFLSDCSVPIWDLKALGTGLGLDENHFASKIQNLSGGYRMRCRLLHLLGSEPNLMLLDEPTNYLDLETLLVLEKFLRNYRGALLLISHDREFLKRVTDHTLEVESGEVQKYPGDVEEYLDQKALVREQLEREAESVAQKKKKVLDFAARFGAKATKARQVQSRLKQLDKMESIEIKALPLQARINIPEPARIGKVAIKATEMSLGYEDKTILSGVTLHLMRGDHIGVVGFNGAGKSTLLKALAGVLTPAKGEISYGMDVECGYYAQHVSEDLDPKSSVFEELQGAAHPSVTRQTILDMAGSMLFSGDDVHKKIRVLSGGEKARVALARILLRKVPLLILDEVTNHLDFSTVEGLTQALSRYQGTLVAVSHDRSFIKRVSKRIYEIRDGRVNEYPGTYDEYVWSLQNGGLSNSSVSRQGNPSISKKADPSQSSVTPPENRSNYKESKKVLDRKIRQLEKREQSLEENVTSLQSRLEQINIDLALPAPENRTDLLSELGRLSLELHQKEEEWLAVSTEREITEAELKAFLE